MNEPLGWPDGEPVGDLLGEDDGLVLGEGLGCVVEDSVGETVSLSAPAEELLGLLLGASVGFNVASRPPRSIVGYGVGNIVGGPLGTALGAAEG